MSFILLKYIVWYPISSIIQLYVILTVEKTDQGFFSVESLSLVNNIDYLNYKYYL